MRICMRLHLIRLAPLLQATTRRFCHWIGTIDRPSQIATSNPPALPSGPNFDLSLLSTGHLTPPEYTVFSYGPPSFPRPQFYVSTPAPVSLSYPSTAAAPSLCISTSIANLILPWDRIPHATASNLDSVLLDTLSIGWTISHAPNSVSLRPD